MCGFFFLFFFFLAEKVVRDSRTFVPSCVVVINDVGNACCEKDLLPRPPRVRNVTLCTVLKRVAREEPLPGLGFRTYFSGKMARYDGTARCRRFVSRACRDRTDTEIKARVRAPVCSTDHGCGARSRDTRRSRDASWSYSFPPPPSSILPSAPRQNRVGSIVSSESSFGRGRATRKSKNAGRIIWPGRRRRCQDGRVTSRRRHFRAASGKAAKVAAVLSRRTLPPFLPPSLLLCLPACPEDKR